jgi:hypothetical protein
MAGILVVRDLDGVGLPVLPAGWTAHQMAGRCVEVFKDTDPGVFLHAVLVYEAGGQGAFVCSTTFPAMEARLRVLANASPRAWTLGDFRTTAAASAGPARTIRDGWHDGRWRNDDGSLVNPGEIRDQLWVTVLGLDLRAESEVPLP